MPKSIFNKVTGLPHKCFRVNFAKLLITPILKNIMAILKNINGYFWILKIQIEFVGQGMWMTPDWSSHGVFLWSLRNTFYIEHLRWVLLVQKMNAIDTLLFYFHTKKVIGKRFFSNSLDCKRYIFKINSFLKRNINRCRPITIKSSGKRSRSVIVKIHEKIDQTLHKLRR